MADNFTQINRFIAIDTPLGPDKLLLQSFSGTEAVSQLFTFHLELLSEDHEIDISQILGKSVTITVDLPENSGGQRYFNGFISRFRQLPGTTRLARYQAEMSPWLWFLTRTTDCRIFQNKSVPDILETIFRDFKFKDFENQVQSTYEPWDYCVQYRESACHFVMRLLEMEGVYFFFRHEKTRHVLVMADKPSAHQPLEPAKISYENISGTGYAQPDNRVNSWLINHDLRTGRYAVSDYNFETPSRSLLANVDSNISAGDNHPYETYEYPGGHETRDEGDKYVRLRMETEEAQHATIQGEGNCRHFSSGFRFELSGHNRRDQNQAHVLTSVTHDASIGGNFPDATSAEDHHYQNSFTCIPVSVPFRPGRQTPKSVVQGAQTAVVVGPSGEEIYTDQHGRVKVQFHWDRYGKMDENSSCWVRVSQNWAGKRWGAMFLPRIGQEVIVSFLEGDPDLPIITGRVYNGDNTPPYVLPDEMTKSTIKSYSSKGGGGFNELRFEDKKGSEQVFIHAEKDLHLRIKNDRLELVERDLNLHVKRDKVEKIERDQQASITRDFIVQAGRDHHFKIKGKQAIEITGSQSLSVTGDVAEEFKGNHSEQVTGNLYLKGMQVVVEATTGLTIKVGSNFITLNPAGIFIQGTLVNINSGGSALSGSAGSLVSPTAPIDPLDPDDADPGAAGSVPAKQANHITGTSSSSGRTRKRDPALANAPSHNPNAPENSDKKSWVEIELKDEAGKAVPGEKYRVTLPDGQTLAEGTLDEKGFARVENIDPGSCKITFPELDQEAWKPK